MMIIISTLEIDGFFSFIASKALSYSPHHSACSLFLHLSPGLPAHFW
jgi:Na+/H+ antiporter NhaD/arsenite permease-like protein